MRDLLHLESDEWGIAAISVIPALINIVLFTYVYFFLPSNRTNIYFALFLLFLALGQCTDGFVRMSPTTENAMAWIRINTPIWLFIMPFGLLFSLRFSDFKKLATNRYIRLLIFLPTLFLVAIDIAGLDTYTIVPSENWRWTVNPDQTLATVSVLGWISIEAAVMLGLLWLSYVRRKKTNEERTSTFLLAVGFTVPFIGGFVSEVLSPLLFGNDAIPLTTPLITVFSVLAVIAIMRHKLLDYSPRHQWDQIIHSVNEGILIVDNDDRIRFTNEAFCSMVGYTSREMLGKIAYQLFIDNDEGMSKIRSALTERNMKKSGTYEIQLRTKSGDKLWVLTNGAPYLDNSGKVIGSIGIHTDIDYLKKAQREILESKERLDMFIEESPLSIHITDPKTGKLIYANPAFYQLLGYERDELKFLTLYDFINHTRKDIDDKIANVIANGRMNPVQREWKTKRGKIINVITNTYYQKNADGSEAIYVAAQDVTQLIDVREQLIATNNELEFFIYRASHDLRAPLASILGLTNVGQMMLNDNDALDILSKVDRSAKKLDDILSTLIRSMSIKSSNEFNHAIEPAALISEVLKGLELNNSNPVIKVNVVNMLPAPIVSNRLLLRTVFSEIIENAIVFRHTERPQPSLKISISEEEHSILMNFEDNGIGIAPSIRDKVFDMYFKGTEESAGAGLGLYLVRKAVERLNGIIDLKSNPGLGTHICITIPRTRMPD